MSNDSPDTSIWESLPAIIQENMQLQAQCVRRRVQGDVGRELLAALGRVLSDEDTDEEFNAALRRVLKQWDELYGPEGAPMNRPEMPRGLPWGDMFACDRCGNPMVDYEAVYDETIEASRRGRPAGGFICPACAAKAAV